MCGIVGYVGDKNAKDIVLKGLSRLEYRGYDSAGIAVIDGKHLNVGKKAGKVADLMAHLDASFDQPIAIGHTRWATHGEPTDRNAHPHLSPSGQIALVHNGIIENYAELKEELGKQGYEFQSDTDTEVLVVLIEAVKNNAKVNTEEAIRLALQQVVGAYAIVVLDVAHPNQLFVAKKGSPLVIGIGADHKEYFIASDATPMVEYTRDVVYLEDGQMAVMGKDKKLSVSNIKNGGAHNPYIDHLELSVEAIEKAGYEHFMLKEIFEQPRAIQDSLRGRVKPAEGLVRLGGIEDYEFRLGLAKKCTIVACGTSYYGGLLAKYWIEKLARMPVEIEYASEYRYRNPIVGEKDVIIAISQSGETADTLAAIDLAKERGALTLGICNVVGSSIARATHAGIYTHAGPEMSVASTKAFSTQLSVLFALALRLAYLKGTISQLDYRTLQAELDAIPTSIEEYLKTATKPLEALAKKYKGATDALFLGRGESYPVAMEGSLKLKELAYVHAEGYAAGEMKHGPIALVDKDLLAIVIAPDSDTQEKTLSNLQEIKARKGKIIAVVNEATKHVTENANDVIVVPKVHPLLSPFITVVPLQLFAYYSAIARGADVDKPRNLAKSVTVE